ncbi:MAG: class I SAM-dependent methyltransferase [Ignavibacterium sp.]|nr:MAG: class I SAM-dependent methyltransferase [Ignavibacterium sp.]
MKNFIPQIILDFLKWQKIKYLNRSKHKEKIIKNWIRDCKKGFTPHVIKQEVIRHFQKKYSIKTLVETGTFMGEMVYAQRNNFEKIISIELSRELFNVAQKRLKKYKNVEIINGDSGKLLKQLVAKISDPAIFWLDGHYSGFETAKGDIETPIKQELGAILNSELNHIILIDDARLFIGQNDYPTIEALKKYILSKKTNYMFNIEDDIIRVHK